MLVSGGDQRRDRWLLVLSGARNGLLVISFFLILSLFQANQAPTLLRRTIFAEVAAMLIFGAIWLIWQRSGMALYQQRARIRARQGATPDYNYRAVLTGWLAFIFTMVGSIIIAVLVSLAGF